MICTFMNKNRKLFDFEYDEKKEIIDKVFNIKDTKYLPYSLSNYKDELDLYTKFNSWINNRYMKNSSWFKRQKWQYGELSLANDIVIKSYGLSLSDQYWIKPSFSKEEWKSVNFFENDFKYKPFVLNMERKYDYKDVDVLYSPNIVTGGELNKTWAILENGKRVLYKSSNTFLGLEPINEYIASIICEILDVSHVKYEIKILSNLDKKIMVSSCETFINTNTEFIPASEIFNKETDNNLKLLNEYIEFLTNKGITNAEEKMKKMLLLDYIMGNGDRHLNNFGVIRDVNTLEFLDIAPIFDTGRSMTTEFNSFKDYDETFTFFRNIKVPKTEYEKLLTEIKLTKGQVEKLKKVPNTYKELISKYEEYTYLKERTSDIKNDLIKFITSNIEDSLSFIEIN